jgi:long-chain acyl-CoA synthetase
MHPGLHAQQNPDKPALVLPAHDTVVTYGQLDAGSTRAARLFRSLGLQPGDGIAMLLENHPRFYEVAWGAQRSGLYYTPPTRRRSPRDSPRSRTAS